MVVETEIPVRYAETDAMGVVYHANYLLYFEVARTDFLEKIGYPYARIESEGLMSPVVDVHLKYGLPLRYGDTALVRTKVTKVTPVKTTYTCEVYRKGQDVEHEKPCVVGETVLTLVDKQTFKPVSQKRELPSLYEMYQQVLEPSE